ncbi:MAG: hypothetical protein AAF544_10950 [Bacteroidota bacterium]
MRILLSISMGFVLVSLHGQLMVNPQPHQYWRLFHASGVENFTAGPNGIISSEEEDSLLEEFHSTPWLDYRAGQGGSYDQLFSSEAGHSPSIFIPKDHLAFFCRIELHLEKATRMPIKFRLGSVDYVDRLEGKRAW